MDLSNWLRLIIIGTCWYIAIRFSYYAIKRYSWILGCYALTLMFAGSHHIFTFLSTTGILSRYVNLFEVSSGWASILALACLYCGLIHLIRQDKPKVARFPIYFTALPFLIVLTYPFAHDTEVIDQWLFQIYQGGALVIGLMIYGMQMMKYAQSYYYKALGSIGLFAICYISYWFLEDIQLIQSWLWQLMYIAGLILIFSGYKQALEE